MCGWYMVLYTCIHVHIDVYCVYACHVLWVLYMYIDCVYCIVY